MNTNHKYLNNRGTLITLLNMGMPIKLIALCLEKSERTVSTYISSLRGDNVWHGEVVSFTDSIHHMLMIYSVIISKAVPMGWMNTFRLEDVLCKNISTLLQFDKISEISALAFKNISKLLEYGFSDDVPEPYQKFLNILDDEKLWMKSDLYWSIFLGQYENEDFPIKIDYKDWPNSAIDEVMRLTVEDIRPNIAPVFTSEVIAKVDNILKTLTNQEAAVIRLYFGLDGPTLTLRGVGERLGFTSERARQIKEQALKRLSHNSRRAKILAFPLSWERVVELLDGQIIPETISDDSNRLVYFDFSTRVLNALKHANIETLDDLGGLTRTALSKYRNLGKKGLDEIDAMLIKHGFEKLND